MTMLPRTPPAAAAIALSALATVSLATRAEEPAPNAGMRYVSAGAQADSQHNQEALAVVSLPVGQHAWVQAGGGKSHSDPQAGGYRPGIVTGSVGVAGHGVQLTVNASHRADASRYRQTDWGSSLDWRHGGGNVGLDVSHRQQQASGVVAVSNALGGSTAASTQARVSGTGVGVHGGLQVSEHVSVYGSAMRSHYRSSTEQAGATASGGLLTRVLPGVSSLVNIDELALNRSAQVGATYRWSKVAVSGEYTTGQVYDGEGAIHSVALKAAIDVAPGWRVAPGVGRGSGDEGGHANFASLSATYGW